jgi:hypothetical protein
MTFTLQKLPKKLKTLSGFTIDMNQILDRKLQIVGQQALTILLPEKIGVGKMIMI